MSADPEIWTARKNDLEIKQRTSSFIASISSISKLREKASSQDKKKALLQAMPGSVWQRHTPMNDIRKLKGKFTFPTFDFNELSYHWQAAPVRTLYND